MTRSTIMMSLCAMTVVLTGALEAEAETLPSDQGTVESSARGAHEHDGFYLRFGLGFGPFSNTIVSDKTNARDERAEGQLTGIASVGEIMVGGAIAPQWILGGGAWSSTVLTSRYSDRIGDEVPTELRQSDNFTLLGPFGDWYFTHEPEAGQPGAFHAQAGAGLAVLDGFRTYRTRDDDEHRPAYGGGFMVGIGYEWWIEPQWGVGVLARMTAAGLAGSDANHERWYHGVAALPALMLTATYN